MEGMKWESECFLLRRPIVGQFRENGLLRAIV